MGFIIFKFLLGPHFCVALGVLVPVPTTNDWLQTIDATCYLYYCCSAAVPKERLMVSKKG